MGLDLTYYKSNSKDQIIPVPVSNAVGFSTFVTNAGEIENQGIEAILRATPIKNENFRWDITLNASYNKNEIISIREGIDEIVVGSQYGYAGSSVSLRLIEGEAYGNIFGSSYERTGADPQQYLFKSWAPSSYRG